MADTSTVVALVVAAVALLIAAFQLTQQLMSTAYVVRKCDRVVTGGVTKGGRKEWHWRQFRFTVKYQAVAFALPAPLYSALGVQSTVQVCSPSQELWDRALKPRPKRTAAQGCWISFLQDIVMSTCISPKSIGLKEESGDRVPEDLTVAPTRVDTITVLLTCVAMGMRVSKYAPTTGEISMAGPTGAISSSVHPVLGGLLHYSVFTDEPAIGFGKARRHGHALLQARGVWANAVFGRFMDRSYQPEFVPLAVLRARKLGVLVARGWPQDSVNDTIGGAACFMAFSHVDVYDPVPPSSVRVWCAHFAEGIVQSHLVQLVEESLKTDVDLNLSDFYRASQQFINIYGCSSPYLPWERLDTGEGAGSKDANVDLFRDIDPQLTVEPGKILACPSLVACAVKTGGPGVPPEVTHDRDPSSYVPMAAAWDAIVLADRHLRIIYTTYGRCPDPAFGKCSEKIVASAIRALAEVGAPSWGRASKAMDEWPRTFSAACDEVLKEQTPPVDEKWVRVYARLSILRAAYFTIMMRSAGSVGPGITEDTVPDTALAYMA